jgi:S1-C subfamily serine protease
MVPSNILQRTHRILFGSSTGTAFTLDVDSRQYLITAKHVVDGINENDVIYIQHNSQWKKIPCQLVGLGDGDLDIAVLSLPVQISPNHPLSFSNTNFYLGQDIYFLGYPYGLYGELKPNLNADFPLPLVKKGIISSFIFGNDRLDKLLLDGHNNPGFSGGPVFYKSVEQQDVYGVAGVISSYKFEWYPVFQNGNETDLVYQYNTGIIHSIGILVAIDLIKANPIGYLF